MAAIEAVNGKHKIEVCPKWVMIARQLLLKFTLVNTQHRIYVMILRKPYTFFPAVYAHSLTWLTLSLLYFQIIYFYADSEAFGQSYIWSDLLVFLNSWDSLILLLLLLYVHVCTSNQTLPRFITLVLNFPTNPQHDLNG
jgi:hypothetical protein